MAKAKLTKLPDTFKFNRWVEEFIKTGNATQSVLKTYDTTNYSSAGVIAAENLKKLRGAAAVYLESKGKIDYGKMVDIAVVNMLKAGHKNATWWQEVMKLTGWEAAKQPEVIVNTQMNLKIGDDNGS